MSLRRGFQTITSAYERFFDGENGVPRWRQLGEIAAVGTGLIITGVITGENAITATGATVDGLALAMSGCRGMIEIGVVQDANMNESGEF